MLTTPFALVQDGEDFVARAVEQRDPESALNATIACVESLVSRPDLLGRALFVPMLDQLVVEIGESLAEALWPRGVDATDGVQLVVATETYDTGGHTRVIEDLCHHLERPVIVLTDLFGRVGSGALRIDHLRRQAAGASVQVLAPGSALAKTIDLMRLVAQLRPQRVLMLTHHQDAIACAALSPQRLRVPRAFIHHGDHNPSLGCTIETLHHVDLVRQTGEACTLALQRDTGYLPLHVRDQGARPWAGRTLTTASVATCGAPQKYARSGPLAYSHIVATVLSTVGGRMHHIGPLPVDWLAQIRDHLSNQGIDAGRFRAVGPVPSLWACLRELDADVYLASAPIGGGRSAIEAQGCGLPIVYFHPESLERPLLATEVYHASAPGWAALDDLPQALRNAVLDGASQSRAARAFYEAGHGDQAFAAAVQRMHQHSRTLVG